VPEASDFALDALFELAEAGLEAAGPPVCAVLQADMETAIIEINAALTMVLDNLPILINFPLLFS
jgi:hypothetical protein